MDTSSIKEAPLVNAIMHELTRNESPGRIAPLLGLTGSLHNRLWEAIHRGVVTWLLANEMANGLQVRQCGSKDMDHHA